MPRIVTFILGTLLSLSQAQEKQNPQIITLWPKGNPNGWNNPAGESISHRNGVKRVHNVNLPTIAHYSPTKSANGKAVIICPGGGYSILAIDKEGHDIAQWLTAEGYHTFVLKYRLPRRKIDKVRFAPALQDAQRALNIVHSKSQALNLKKIGIMGFSAGGHLSAVTTCTEKQSYIPQDNADLITKRPDFTALIYPAYLVKDKKSLSLNKEVQLPTDMPPIFMLQTSDDPIPVENSLAFYMALKKKKSPCQLHIYPKVPHGYGIKDPRTEGQAVSQWPQILLSWLNQQ